MKLFAIVLLSLSLSSCAITFHKKGYDVRKAANDLSAHIAVQKDKLSQNYKQHVKFYRLLQNSGLSKKKAPMPELLKYILEMRKLAVEAKAMMKKLALKTARMREIADGKKRIPDTDPEYQEIDDLTESIKAQIGPLEKVAKKYGEASNNFSRVAKENDLYLVKPDELRLRAEKLETVLLDMGRQAKTKEGHSEVIRKGREIQALLDKLLERLGDDEVAIGPHSDPKVTLDRIKTMMNEMKSLLDEL